MRTVRSVIIVGGGSSGWMAAAYLSRILFDIKFTLIESKTTPRLGVGEATTPILTDFMKRLGFPKYASWLPQCDGTLKTANLFENWFERGDVYWHPFELLDYVDDRCHTGHCWLPLHRAREPEFQDRNSFYRTFYRTAILNWTEHRCPVNSAFSYHINADRFGDFLRGVTPAVQHIHDDVVDIRLNHLGEIEELQTQDHGCFQADLFVDCSGFRRLLIEKVNESSAYECYSESLFCDRAVVVRFPYDSELTRPQQMHPYVKVSAQSAGWIWTIPLYSRISCGYVYSSSFLSEDAAEEELRRYCGMERTRDTVAQKIRFQSGKMKKVWAKNCVAIGLAGCFIEPLEGTGLAITQAGLGLLGSVLDARYYDSFIIERYNMHLQKIADDIKNFIVVHYALTNREDTPFWRAVKYRTAIPPQLQNQLEVFKRLLPSANTKGTQEQWFFKDFSWFSVLLGMNFPFEVPEITESQLKIMRSIQQHKAQEINELRAKVPSHYDFLQKHVYREVPLENESPPEAAVA